MANILGLALKISADSTQLKLTPVEKALQALSSEAEKATSSFDKFADTSAAAAEAQQRASESFAQLSTQLQKNQLSASEFVDQFQQLGVAVNAEAEAFARAAEITQSVITPAEEFRRKLAELDEQVSAGRISAETYAAAVEALQKQYSSLDTTLTTVQERAGKVAQIFGSVGDVFTSVSGAASGIGNAIKAISEAGSSVIQFGFDIAKATAAFKVFQAVTSSYNVPQGILGLVLNLGKFLTVIKVAEVAAAQLGVDISGVADAATKASLVFAGFKVGALLGLDKAIAPAIATLGTQLPNALARVGVPLAATNAAGAAITATFTRLLGFSIPGFGQLAAAVYTGVRAFVAAKDRAFDLAEQLREGVTTAELLNAQFGDRTANNVVALAAAITQVQTAQAGLSAAAQTVSDAFVIPFIGAFAKLQEGYASLVNGISSISSGIGSVLTPFAKALEPVVTAVGSAITFFADLIGIIGNVVGEFLSLAGSIVGVPLQAVAANLGVLSDGFSFLLDGIITLVETGLAPLRALMSGLELVFTAVGDALSQILSPANAVQSIFATVSSVVSDQLSPAFQFLSNAAERAGRIVQAAFEQVQAYIQTFTEVFVAIIGENIAAFLEFTGIGDAVAAVARTIGDVFGSAWEIVRGVASTIGGLIERVLAFAEDWLGIAAQVSEPVVLTYELDTGDALAQLVAENKEVGNIIDEVTKSVSKAIDESAQFGQAGFDAALRYQQSIDDLKQNLAGGLFNEETFRIEAEKARVAFDAELQRIEQDAKLNIQIEENATRTLQGLRQQINEVVADSARLGEAGFDAAFQYQTALEDLQRQFEQGVINETTLAAEANKARAIYDDQVKSVEARNKAQQQQIENDRKVIESLFQVSDASQKITDGIVAIDREIARTQDEFARAVAELDGAAAINAQRRIDELTQKQGELETQLQAAAQGFEGGFERAFAAVGGNFNRLAEQAAQFGDAGNAAAVRLQEGIAAAQEQARDGILNRAAFEAEVARQQQLFEQELANVKAVADERAKVNELVDQRFLLARFGGDQQRLTAAQNLAALEREIGRVQADVQAARAAGNQEEVNAGIARLGQLDQVAAQERDIASGRRQLEQQLGQQREQYLKQLEQQQQQAQQAQQKYLEEQAKAVEAENQRQVARIRELNTLGSGVIQGNDIRTAEGAALFLNLAANQQDPALIEARLQTRRLTELRDTLVAISAQFAGPVVQIGGGVG
jgi:phage-related protein